MRLHRLSMTAFGPFPDTAEIDFTELNEAGLFLLTGPTGAGKTSVLDAICFALFGSVPGARGVKALKSDHAGPQARPEVVLDFSVRERRFVVRRTPEWTRPKRRGSGTTTEKAAATLVETTSGSEHLLSSRAQEVGHFIADLVGMNAGQFVQVAMLPQGEFQQFLRASSQDRHDVLQHLFKTDRFARIEAWVHDHSQRLAVAAGTGEQEVRRILHTVAHRAERELPDDLEPLDRAAAEDRLLPFVAGLVREATARERSTAEAHAAVTRAVDSARAALEQGERATTARARRADAARLLADLEHGAEEEHAARAALDADERAARCTAVLDLLESTRRTTQRADRRLQTAVQLLGADAERGLPGHLEDGLEPSTLEAAQREVSGWIARVEVLLPREAALVAAHEQLNALRTERTAALARRASLAARGDTLPDALAELRAELAAARRSAGRREALELARQRATERAEAAGRVPALRIELAVLQDRARDARDDAAAARERLHELIARRLAGMAAELAGRLTDGAPCQVCGSVEHPHPAPPAVDAVTAEEQQAASDAYDAAALSHTRAIQRVTEAEQRLEALQAAADDRDADTAAEELDRLDAELRAAVAAGQLADRLAADEERLVAEREQVTAGLHDLDTTLTALEVRVGRLERDVAEITTEIREVTRIAEAGSGTRDDAASPAGLPSVGDLLLGLRRRRDRLHEAATALTDADHARGRLAEVTERAFSAVGEQDFDDLDACRRAVLGSDRRAQLHGLLEERAAMRNRATAVLDAPDLEDPVGDLPDLVALRTALAEVEGSRSDSARAHHHAEAAARALEEQHRLLQEALESWAPAREEHGRAEAMAELVRGMGSDNQLQMRLSAYVLATRLDQVVAAANDRLAQMRDQRYLLQRTGRAARRGSRAGLGLEVVDQWTGETREPTTLSGGETFVVSLALALGLADVVTNEAGGTEIETLFVDEGFGSLDPDTLDDVMDRLDGLRAGGRTVGVVSHVAEMRNRIPTQVHVDKQRSGSTVAVRTLVG